jgi:hypothetical protein
MRRSSPVRRRELSLLGRDAIGEIFQKRFFGQSGEAIMFLDAGAHGASGKFSGQRDKIFAGIGGTRGDID